MRTFAVLALPILLNACALPAAFSIATLAVDGISYATSGKGLSDHAISAVASEDCAMWRVLQARPICRDQDVPETMVAAAPGVAAAPAADESEVLAVVLGAAPAAGGPMAPETMVAAATEFGEFEVTAAAFAALPAAGGSMVGAAPEPDGSEAPAAVFAVAPPAGGPMAPETARLPKLYGGQAKAEIPAETPAEMPAATASPAKRPKAMAAPKPEPLAAMTGTPATTAAPAERGTAAKPVQLAALAARLPEMEARPKPGRFVVLGSYLKEANARDAMKRGHEFAPRMVRVRVHGKPFHRVVSGPYARDAIGTMRRTLIGEGFPDAWTAKLCQDTLRLAPCPTAPAPLNVSANSPAS